MRRGATAARLTLAAGAALVAAVAQVLPQRLAEALDPAPADVLVGAALAAVGVLVARRSRPAPALLLGAAAVVWTAVGAAPLIGGVLEDPVLRLALLPHALLVVVLATLPSGRLRERRTLVVSAFAIATALVAGTGRLPFPLAAVGVVALVSAFPARDPTATAARVGFGSLLLVVDVGTTISLIPPAAGASTVDIGLVAVAAALPRLLDREAQLWAAATDAAELIGARLGRALGVEGARVIVPSGSGWIDPAGSSTAPADACHEVRDPAGDLVAVISPAPRLDPMLGDPLARLLSRVADTARSRERERLLAVELERSRRLLLEAGDEERRDLERRVGTVVGGRIAAIGDRLIASGAARELVDRAAAARAELLRVGAAPPLDDPAAFAECLIAAGGAHATIRVELDVMPPSAVATVLWFACTEGLANAGKHAPGAAVRVGVDGFDGVWRAVVEDDGPGGATADGGGLAGIADRAADQGGLVALHSNAAGTRLTVTIPRNTPAVSPTPVRDLPDPLVPARL